MIDTEARVRATLTAVAAATAVHHPEAAYVETPPPPPRRLPVRLLGVAAAAAAVAAAVLVSAPTDRATTTPAAPPPSVDPIPAGPEGGRLLLRGTVGGRPWALYGADLIAGLSEAPGGRIESPCWALMVEGAEHPTRGCGTDGQTLSGFHQLGRAAGAGSDVLLFGVLGADVAKVVVQLDTDRPAVEVTPVIDPVHPDGARYMVVALPAAGIASVRLVGEGDRVIHSVPVALDGPVGG